MVFQRGSALPLLLLLLAGSGILWFGKTTVNAPNKVQNQHETSMMLMAAKRALMAFAIAYSDNYQASGAGIGHLPCPDLDPIDDGVLTNDGPNPPCGQQARQIGRLPRQTYTYASPDPEEPGADRLGKRIEFYSMRSLRDEQPWYVVSSAFVNNPHTTIVNSLTKGTLSVDGQDDIAAIVIAPGPALHAQHQYRPGNSIKDYLEGTNADGDTVYTAKLSSKHNDRLIVITARELSAVLEKRALALVVRWLTEFNRRNCAANSMCYPFAAMDSLCKKGSLQGSLPLMRGDCDQLLSHQGKLDAVPPEQHWFVRNNWHELIQYEVSSQCLIASTQECEIDITYGRKQGTGVSIVTVRPPPAVADSVHERQGRSDV